MAIKISGTTVIDDSRNLVNINSGLGVGIQSGGNSVGTGITVLNFVGTGTTISVSSGRANISAGGGSIGTTGITTQTIFSNPSFISASIALTQGNNNYGAFGPITVAVGATVTVGAGNTWVIV
jgi:hypothetical protein